MNLAEVTQYAALQFSPAETETLLHLPAGSITKDAAAMAAHDEGRLKALAIARRALYDLAVSGDRAAVQQFCELGNREQTGWRRLKRSRR